MTSHRGAVLVSGASSGIGRATAARLARAGYRVFAGVRSDRSAEELRSEHDGIQPIKLDVTDAASIAAAKKEVEGAAGAGGLRGLVNNAGIGLVGPLECQPIEEVRLTFETNVIGMMAVTQAFLPLIRRGGGRIVNIGSGAGFLALPFEGAYSGSKFAVEAVSDSLRRDLRPWRISVVIVEPGFTRTQILEKGEREIRKLFANLPPEDSAMYRRTLDNGLALMERFMRNAVEPDKVAAAVQRALSVRFPRTRYPVGSDAWAARLLRFVPGRLMDFAVGRLWRTEI